MPTRVSAELEQNMQRCSESSDDSYLSGHLTLPALAEKSQSGQPNGDEIGTYHAENEAVHSDETHREDDSITSRAHDSVAALEGTAPHNESASKLRQRLKALKKQEQELVQQQWKANKLEKVRTVLHKGFVCGRGHILHILAAYLPFFTTITMIRTWLCRPI